MRYGGLFEMAEKMRDSVQSAKMSAYMQNRFEFLGIPKPALKELIKPYLKAGRRLEFDWDFVFLCWDKPYREAQYIALEYLKIHQKSFMPSDLDNVRRLITEKSWWETVDTLDETVGIIVAKEPALKSEMLKWSVSENMWLRRAAIDFQQEYKEATDAALLEKIIVNNLGSEEYFINKAIGWSLRDYSKTNAEWVRGFIGKYRAELSPLSVKEASKLLK